MSKAAQLAAARNAALRDAPFGPVLKCPKKLHEWIEIVLEDDNGTRIPEEEYLIIAPDGERYAGVLDQNGFARVDHLPPGECKVSFPRIDRREWAIATKHE